MLFGKPCLLCACNGYQNELLADNKIYLTEVHTVFAFQKLLCWFDSSRLSASCETQEILIEMLYRMLTLERFSVSDTPFFFRTTALFYFINPFIFIGKLGSFFKHMGKLAWSFMLKMFLIWAWYYAWWYV